MHPALRKMLDAHALFYARKFPHMYGKTYNPDEPRIPAGQPDAGEWTYGLDGIPTFGDDSSLSDDTTELAAGDGMPGDPQRANKQVTDIETQLGMTKDQKRELHDTIHGQNYGYHEVLKIAKDIVGK